MRLEDYERGAKYAGDYAADLKALQERLARIQSAYIVQGGRAIVALEGWDASGKGGAISRLTAEMDPRYFAVYPIGAPNEEERERPFLWRFWTRLPGRGDIAIFDRSWYGRVLVERVEGFASEAEWRRAYDEINEFEARQIEAGTTLVKLFLHVTQEEQDRRLADRLDHPWKRWKTGTEDYRNRARRADYLQALRDMFAQTDTRWAPWTVVDAGNKKAARITVLGAVADRLEGAIDMTPPAPDPAVVTLAKAAFGYAPKG